MKLNMYSKNSQREIVVFVSAALMGQKGENIGAQTEDLNH